MMTSVALADAPVTSDLPVIELVSPIPGFPEDDAFTLVRLDEDGILCRLQSLRHDRLQFLVVPAVTFFPDYAPEVDDDAVEALGIESAADVIVVLIINAAATLAETTANLRAPLLINTRSNRAAQVILDDISLPIAAPLLG